MELDEELVSEEEKHTVVGQQAHADCLDNTEDVIMQSEDEDSTGRVTEDLGTEVILELSTSEEELQTLRVKKVVPKRSQVYFFVQCCRCNRY